MAAAAPLSCRLRGLYSQSVPSEAAFSRQPGCSWLPFCALLCSMLFELLVNLQTCGIQVISWIITCRCGSCCRMAQLGAALSPWSRGTSRDLLARPTRTPRQLQQQLRLSWPSQAEGPSILRPSVVPRRSSSRHHAVCPCAALECSHLSPYPLQSGSVHILLCPTSAEWRLISAKSHDTSTHSGWDLHQRVGRTMGDMQASRSCTPLPWSTLHALVTYL